jgi:HEAT repeat protein
MSALAESLEDGYLYVQAHAARALGNFGKAAASTVTYLTRALLADRTAAGASPAGNMTWRDGPAYDYVRFEVIQALRKIGPEARTAIPALREAMKYQQLVRDAAEQAIRVIEQCE